VGIYRERRISKEKARNLGDQVIAGQRNKKGDIE
jgi:hypothetical protein